MHMNIYHVNHACSSSHLTTPPTYKVSNSNSLYTLELERSLIKDRFLEMVTEIWQQEQSTVCDSNNWLWKLKLPLKIKDFLICE